MPGWSFSDIPSQRGRRAIVTGTGGLGYETALALARAGSEVILAGRNARKGAESVKRIMADTPAATIAFEPLDLASLASVEDFAGRMLAAGAPLDLLVNNAGVMTPPTRRTTADGFELQFGTNYLGHFALTGRLLPLLMRGQAPRVVSLSSLAHRGAAVHFDDLQWERSYRPWAAYGQSKLAMLMFAFELQRRSDARGWGLTSNAAHPGYARTDLIANGPGVDRWLFRLTGFLRPLVSQSAADGALPTLFAAVAPEARGGAYYGPNWVYELKGPPTLAKASPQAQDRRIAAKLWEASERLTKTPFPP